MKIAWTTDPHLNFVDDEGIERFLQGIRDQRLDVLLVGGDIGEAPSFAGYLQRLAVAIDRPVYFVLGNHDYYRSSISDVRNVAETLSDESDRLNWLSRSDHVLLSDKSALVGHGGWGDARAADFLNSDVVLNDYLLIEELRAACNDVSADNILSPRLQTQLHSLGDEAADHFRRVLPDALRCCSEVVVLMHVPPFREACWHDGNIADDKWAPHFTCVAAGDVLLEFAERFPGKRITVLCGHTHSAGYVKIRENLEVWTGGAEYGQPQVQRVLEIA